MSRGVEVEGSNKQKVIEEVVCVWGGGGVGGWGGGRFKPKRYTPVGRIGIFY